MNKRSALLIVLTLGLSIIVCLYAENGLDNVARHLSVGEETFFYPIVYYLTFLASKNIIIPFVILGGIYLYKRFKHVYPSLVLILGTLIGYLTNEGIKAIIQRPRPSVLEAVHATGYSFPSGHSMTAFISYFIFVYFLMQDQSEKTRRRAYLLTSLLVLLLGFTRIALGVHFLTDVIGGFLFGAVYLKVLFYFFPKKKYLKLKE